MTESFLLKAQTKFFFALMTQNLNIKEATGVFCSAHTTPGHSIEEGGFVINRDVSGAQVLLAGAPRLILGTACSPGNNGSSLQRKTGRAHRRHLRVAPFSHEHTDLKSEYCTSEGPLWEGKHPLPSGSLALGLGRTHGGSQH